MNRCLIRYARVGGGYVIPFNEMSAEVSEDVMSLLEVGWVLFRDLIGNYLLIRVDKKYISYQLDAYENLVSNVCKKYQIPYYMVSPISTNKYFSNTFLQKVIDSVLLGYLRESNYNEVGGKYLGFTMNGSKVFCLVEVDEGGVK